MQINQPQQIGQYVLEGSIGSGGMGKVYRAQHPTLKRPVAIKLLQNHLTQDEKTRLRFAREAKTVAQLRHPNIIEIYDFGVEDDHAYIVMQYADGGTLRDLLDQHGALPHADALRIAAQLAAALDYAHQHGIIHRDLKPANIMFTDDTHQQAVLTDFGLVRVLGATIVTEYGEFIGTPAYVSPEVASSEPAIPASDMYALGLLLVEMLTGQHVVSSKNLGAVIYWHVAGQRPDLSGLGLPSNISTMISRLMSVDPIQRPTAADIIVVLRANDTTQASDDDTLADDTVLIFDQTPPTHQARLVGALPLTFDEQRPFVGRADDLERLGAALSRRERVIAVVGKSGIGKSALVSKVLANALVSDHNLNGVVAASAQGSENDSRQLTIDTVLASFQTLLPNADLGPNPQATPEQDAQRLVTALEVGKYILLLDNIETLQADDHSVRDAGIAALLEAAIDAEGLSIVITSQVPLRLKGVGKTARVTTIKLDSGLDTDAALSLLHQLWTGDQQPNDADLQRLVAAVDGHPRALEAATDWLVEHPLNSVDDLLGDLAQQQGDVVYHLVGKSIDGLSTDLQRLLAALAIFDGSTTLPAVEAVIAPFIDGKARDLLNRLVLRRFVRFDPKARTLDLHTLDRAYSQSLLPQTTDDESVYGRYALLRRAAAYFENNRKPKAEWKTYDDLRPMLNEFAFRVELADYDTAAHILSDIDFDYLLLWGYVRDMAAMHERLQGKISNRKLAGSSAGNLGLAYWRLGQLRDAISLYEHALQLAREDGDKSGEGADLGNLGNAYSNLGDITTAIGYYQQALTISRDIGHKRAEGNNLSSLGNAYSDLGDITTAIDYHQQALTISRDIGDKRGEGADLGNLGIAYSNLGDITTAIDYHQQALTISRDIGDKRAEGAALGYLGRDLAERDEFAAAIEHIQQGLALAREVKTPYFEAEKLLQLGEVYLLQADFNAAHSTLHEATHLDEAEFKHQIAVLRGIAALRLRHVEAARSAFTDAVTAADEVLDKTAQFYTARYALGLAQAGMALLGGTPIDDAIETYRLARKNCDAAGVLRDQRRWLDMLIESDGGAVLQPVREFIS